MGWISNEDFIFNSNSLFIESTFLVHVLFNVRCNIMLDTALCDINGILSKSSSTEFLTVGRIPGSLKNATRQVPAWRHITTGLLLCSDVLRHVALWSSSSWL